MKVKPMKKTIYFNQDNHHFYGCHPASDMTEEGVKALVDFYARPGTIKGILFCANVQRALYDSAVWEHFKDVQFDDPLVNNLRLLSERKIDYFNIWLNRCREHEIEAWMSMRMNDCHGNKESEDPNATHWHQYWPSMKWRASRHLRRAPYRLERSWEGAYDYTQKEVREHHMRLVAELFERFDMDGLELDWMRWGMFFPPGSERESHAIMTEFVREVRTLADAAEKRWGHPIRLAHRVPADPIACLNFGFDVISWAREGFVDMVTLSHFLGNCNYDLPISTWRALLPEGTVINAYVEECAEGHPGAVVINYDQLMGGAAAAWSCGADNLYLFNTCYRETDSREMLLYMLERMASPEALQGTIRRMAATFTQARIAGEPTRSRLPEPLTQSPIGAEYGRMEHNITVRLPAGKVEKGARCVLRIGYSATADRAVVSRFPVRVNTVPVQPCEWPKYEGLKPGFKTARATDLPKDAAFTCCYEVPLNVLHETFNAVEILPEPVAGELVWAEWVIL